MLEYFPSPSRLQHVHHAHHLPLFSLVLASHILFSRCHPPAQIRMDVQSGRTGKDTEYM